MRINTIPPLNTSLSQSPRAWPWCMLLWCQPFHYDGAGGEGIGFASMESIKELLLVMEPITDMGPIANILNTLIAHGEDDLWRLRTHIAFAESKVINCADAIVLGGHRGNSKQPAPDVHQEMLRIAEIKSKVGDGKQKKRSIATWLNEIDCGALATGQVFTSDSMAIGGDIDTQGVVPAWIVFNVNTGVATGMDHHYMTVKPVVVETKDGTKYCKAFVQDAILENKAWRELTGTELENMDWMPNNVKWMPLLQFNALAIESSKDELLTTTICKWANNSCYMDCDMVGATLFNWREYLIASGTALITGKCSIHAKPCMLALNVY